jgi:hypothetical protein
MRMGNIITLAVSETNGQGKSRLDCIEEMIERQERANEVAHERFEDEDNRLNALIETVNGIIRKQNAS